MKKKIIIGSGGTGGHMFPAAALADTLRAQNVEIILITDQRGMRFGQDFKNDTIIELPVVNIRKGGIIHKIKSAFQLLKSIIISIKIIQKHKANAVVGFGGYPAFPASMASFLTRRPLFLHEQNAILGRTNKFLKKFSTAIFTSFEKTQHISTNDPSIFTGNLVRKMLHPYAEIPYPNLESEFHILVTGGSQGASVFSKIMPEMCNKLPKDVRQKLIVTHQARSEDITSTQDHYKKYGIKANILPFINDMGAAIAQSHLVICRSGATTIAELGYIGRPALFVPLPSAADDQQTINANFATNLGAGRIINQDDFTPSYVASIITAYYMHPETLMQAANSAKLLTKKEACHNVAQIIIDKIHSFNKP